MKRHERVKRGGGLYLNGCAGGGSKFKFECENNGKNFCSANSIMLLELLPTYLPSGQDFFRENESVKFWLTWNKANFNWKVTYYCKNWAIQGLFCLVSSYLFRQYNFYNNYMWTKSPSSIKCWDLNPWPSGLESHPITTGPGLPPG